MDEDFLNSFSAIVRIARDCSMQEFGTDITKPESYEAIIEAIGVSPEDVRILSTAPPEAIARIQAGVIARMQTEGIASTTEEYRTILEEAANGILNAEQTAALGRSVTQVVEAWDKINACVEDAAREQTPEIQIPTTPETPSHGNGELAV